MTNKDRYVAAMNALPVSEGFAERVRDAARPRPKRRPRGKLAFAAAAVLLCIVVPALFFLRAPAGSRNSGPGLWAAGGGDENFGPGVRTADAHGDTLYFEPFYQRAKTKSVFCWDGKRLTETPAKNADGMAADSGGLYYTSKNILYRYDKGANRVTKLRDLNGDRRPYDVSTRKNFTVRLFHADENGVYAACYGSGENAQGRGESPFFLLRIAPDGSSASLLYADGKGEAGTYLSTIELLGDRIFYSTSGGIYSLNRDGGDRKQISALPASRLMQNGDRLVFIGQKDGIPDSLYTMNRDGTELRRITEVNSSTFLAIQGGKIYYPLDPADHTKLYSGIYAYDFSTGKAEYVMDNKQENEEYTGDYFSRALPAERGLFLIHMAGEVVYYDPGTKKSTTIYGG